MTLRWTAPFDPNETKDYARDWSAELTNIADTLATVNFVVPAEATGLTVAYTDMDATSKIAICWFTSSDVEAVRDLNGQTIPIDHTVVTTNGRTYNETIGLRIKEK